MKLYRHNRYPCHWLNAAPASDWINAISSGGVGVVISTEDYPSEPMPGAAAGKLFDALVTAGYISEMSAKEIEEYSTRYVDADHPDEEPRTYAQLLAETYAGSRESGHRTERGIKDSVDYWIKVGDYVKA